MKDFSKYVLEVTTRIKEASLAAARCAGRPIQYLASSQISKEDLARKIAARDQLAEGLICVLRDRQNISVTNLLEEIWSSSTPHENHL